MSADAPRVERAATDPAKPRIRDRDTLKLFAAARQWWRRTFVATVDQLDVIRRTKEECALVGRYVFMTSMSAGIAVLGLIIPSTAVVIGAMLLSPLMGPIIGAGFALAIWDVKWLRESGKTLFVGVIAAILISALITWMSPIQTITAEIAGRTRPSLLDLGVALFSALAGAYAMIRGRGGTIVGVAIAVALMPPLAVIGFGLATMNWPVFGGALMLFITNLVTITAGAAAMARLYGFRTNLSKKRSRWQSVGILIVLILLAVPLTISLLGIARETRTTTLARNSIISEFRNVGGYLAEFNVDMSAEPISVTAVVNTPRFSANAERLVEERVSASIGEPVDLTLNQLIVANAADAQAEQLSAARNREAAEAAEQRIIGLRRDLSLVTGRGEEEIMIDRDNRRAIARARVIDGASLGAYRELERRVAVTAPDWDIQVVPPLGPIPSIGWNDEGVLDADALGLAAWAAARRDNGVTLTGPSEQLERARAALAAAGTENVGTTEDDGSTIRVTWMTLEN